MLIRIVEKFRCLKGASISKTIEGRCRRVGTAAFSRKFLLYTNVGLCMSLSCAGDVMQQCFKRSRRLADKHDWVRTRNMSVAATTMGVLCHFWYLWLDKHFQGRTISILAKKVILDQVLLSPVMWLAYFAALGVIEGSCVNKFKSRVVDKGGPIYLAEWIVWPPAQVVNFYFLPTRFRMLYDNTVSLGFDWYSSYLLNDHGEDDDDDKDEERKDLKEIEATVVTESAK